MNWLPLGKLILMSLNDSNEIFISLSACGNPFGMETFDIPNYAFLAPGIQNYAEELRLRGTNPLLLPERENEFVQVDLGTGGKTLSALVIEGDDGINNWISKFVVNYSRDGNEFFPYMENGVWKVRLE